MLKQLLLVFSFCLVLSSCGTSIPKSVLLDVDSINSYVSFNIEETTFNYKLSYRDNSFCFTSAESTAPIDFIVEDGTLFSLNHDIKYPINSDSINPIPMLIAKALDMSVGRKVSPDSDGEYKLYDTLREGEYVLLLSNKGKPKLLSIENLNLNVEFI